MTLEELGAKINLYLENPRNKDLEVVIRVKRDFAIGGTPCVDVVSAQGGIDWDSGKFMLYPKTDLTDK